MNFEREDDRSTSARDVSESRCQCQSVRAKMSDAKMSDAKKTFSSFFLMRCALGSLAEDIVRLTLSMTQSVVAKV